MSESRDLSRTSRIDWAGACLAVGGLGSVVFALLQWPLAGASRPLSVTIDREEGFRGYAAVDVEGLPAGVKALPALENPEDKPPLPNGGRLERYTPREQRTAVMLIAARTLRCPTCRRASVSWFA
jgi:hypothetical protein